MTNTNHFTIITVVFNGENHIEQCIQSVLKQKGKIEYIIIDGASTDNTVKIINKYEDQISHLISEPDNGIYDAMNKGISLASGKYVAFLNSDDFYADDTLKKISLIINKEEPDFIYSNIQYIHNEKKSSVWKGNTGTKGSAIPHPSCFIKTNILQSNFFNLKYKIAADYELILRLFTMKVTTYYFDEITVYFRTGGVSSQFLKTKKENFLITKKYFGYRSAFSKLLKELILILKTYLPSFFMLNTKTKT
jgi:glycosyltransferase involved in cell wall biosynthesis